MKTIRVLLAATLVSATTLPAQLVNDGATNTLSDVTNTITGDVIVGTNSSFTLLILSDNTLLTNSASGTIGANVTAKSNEVQLLSASARWLMGGISFVGSNGAFNRLVVSNGARVRDGAAILGYLASSSNNQAHVTGSGSVWNNDGPVYLGFLGVGNQLVVSNGGAVTGNQGYVGVGSSNNLAVVTGSGSVWSNTVEFIVGGAAGNQLLVENGGAVRNGQGYVGSNPSASNNLALITGAGTVWSNALGLEIGGFGAGNNQLIVSNGATVIAARNGLIGPEAGAKANSVTVTDAGTSWLVASNIYVGSNGSFNRLVVSNAGQLVNGLGFVGIEGSNNLAIVTGPGSVWSNRSDVYLGFNNRGNRLLVEDGGLVVSDNARIGLASSLAAFNEAVIAGAGSVWSNRADLFVGSFGNSNRLEVSGGAQVMNNNAHVGALASAGNTALVTGSGSLWSSRADLLVGDGGSVSQLVVSNGATVLVGRVAMIGGKPIAVASTVTVDGSGASWLIASNLHVGSEGSFNRLVITNGGMVTNNWLGVAGYSASSKSNEVVVAGAGSIWRNHISAYVGLNGAGNRMTISDGGQVICTYGAVGVNDSGSNNLAVVTGPESVWDNSRELWVGSSRGNRLVISNGGGAFSVDAGIVGVNSTSHSNAVTITDPGSFWSYGDEMRVGRQGSGNTLVVSNGAWIGGVDGSIGEFAIASNNLAVVTGTNSAWTNLFNFRVGSFGSNNRLIVADGGRIANDAAFIGAIGSRNEALLTGAGTLWTSAAELIVGDQSTNNLLMISNGAVVLADHSIVGNFFNASNNTAVVTGAGSTWSNATTLSVGAFGSRNQLVVTNGGLVFAGENVFLGGSTIAVSNRIVVDGGTLQVTNGAGTAALDVRRGANVLNAGLIDADQLLLTNSQGFFEFNGGWLITRSASISNNAAFIVGGNATAPAIWDVRAGVNNHVLAGELYIGNPFAFLGSSFNQLFVTNGASLTNFSNLNIGIGGNSNTMTISGPGSRYGAGGTISVSGGVFNRLVVSNEGSLFGRNAASIGGLFSSTNNQIVVTGPGSVWHQLGNVEFNARGNQLFVTDGGLLVCSNATEGFFGAGSNLVLVAGSGSVLTCIETLGVGSSGRANQLQVTNGALVTVGRSLVVGASNTSTNNRVLVDGSTLLVTNLAGTGLLEVRRGSNVFNAGLIETDNLRMTNSTLSKFEFNSGTLSVKNSRVSIGPPLIIGNGISPATLALVGDGTHDMSGTLGLIISSNAMLTGTGSLLVQLQVRPGATLSPGASIGKISVNTAPFLSGATVMEISKNGATLTNDQFQVTGTLTYGGTLTVSKLGPTALAAGDSFQLFNATAYADAFTSLNLPPLAPPLVWKNNLLVNGSLEVAAPPAISLSAGPHTQNFDTLATNGSANLWRDNVTLLGWYAAKSVAPTNITTYRAADGSDNAGALYSFGSTGSGERALGSIGSGSVGIISYGLGFTNDTGASVSNFVLSYTGEQWRNSSSLNTNTLTFWYRVRATALTNPEPGSVTDWTPQVSLDFASPTVTGAGVGINGNTPTNRQLFVTVPVSGLSVPPGHCVFFRWQDPDDPGTDEGVAVDDLTVAFGVTLPQFTSVGLTTNGFLQFTGRGQANALFGIETATNLTPPISWQLVFTNTADTNGLFQFSDTNAPAFPMRFYRALFP